MQAPVDWVPKDDLHALNLRRGGGGGVVRIPLYSCMGGREGGTDVNLIMLYKAY